MTAPNFAPGTVVAGKFSIRSLLGYGGASATFRAVSQKGQDVALKAFSVAVGQRRDVMDQLQRYVAETNSLPQELVAPILEAGYDPATATPFTVTEFMLTPSVAQLMMHRPMSVDEVGAMLRTLAMLLDAAHAREVFHHALKPTNLFIDPNNPGNLRVIDFGVGIARSVVPTQEGYVIAAPWLAPEQAQGGMLAGAAADVFAAALVAFFALTGRSYWRSCQGAPDLNLWQREVLSPRTPASVRAAELGAQLSPALDNAFTRALAVDPRERCSMSEFATSFGGLSAGWAMQPVATVALPMAEAYALDPAPAPPAQPSPVNYAAGYPPLEQLMKPQPSPDVGGTSVGGATQVPPTTIASIPGTGPRTPSGRAAPIVVGVAAGLLLCGAVVTWFVIGKSDSEAKDPAPSTSASSSRPAPDIGTMTPPAPPDTAAAEADDAGAEEAGTAVPGDVPVKITCSPEACEAIVIDDQPVEHLSDELRLAPGKHKVTVKRVGFVPQTETIEIESGTPFEKVYALVAQRATTTTTTSTTGRPRRDCSKLKLLERQRCERGQ